MSVILYEDEKFLKIFSSLQFKNDLQFYFGYDTIQLDKTIFEFIQALCHANTEAYNVRYGND